MKEYKYRINGNEYKVSVGDIEDGAAQVEVNGTPYSVELEQKAAPVTIKTTKAAAAPRTSAGEKVIVKPASSGPGHTVKAPLPGVVISINVKVGDVVKADDTVIMLEAMKMENAIHAGRDGKVAAINVQPNESVLEGTALLTIE